MAKAGRVAIRPRGTWDSATAYERLDFVKHKGGAYTAKKDSLGVEPVEGEYWMLNMNVAADTIEFDNTESGLSATDIQSAINELASEPSVPEGVTYIDFGGGEETGELLPVNADTLGGHGVDYFATEDELMSKADGLNYQDNVLSLMSGEETLSSVTIMGGGGDVPDNILFATETTAGDIDTPHLDASTLEGHDSTYFATAESIANIENGTTQVGNAKTLDGHGAEYFVNRTDVLTGSESILEKAKTLSYGMWNFRFNDHDGTDLPNEYYALGNATIFVRTSSHITVVLWGSYYSTASRIQSNYYNGVTWTGWIEEFTTAGGTINGNVMVSKNGAGLVSVEDTANGRQIGLLTSGGKCGLYDYTNSKWIVENTADGTNTFNGTASGNLPISGGGEVSSDSTNGVITLNDRVHNVVKLGFKSHGEHRGYLAQTEAEDGAFRRITPDGTFYKMLDTGNKPTGTYTGNGSATARQINVGGIGNMLLINGDGLGSTIVTSFGGICAPYDGTSVAFIKDVAFQSGVLYMSTDSKYVNTNGKEFRYEVK